MTNLLQFFDKMIWSLYIYFFLFICQTMQAPICIPTITEGKTGKPEIDGYLSLECEISTCTNPTKVVFEKAGFNATWTPIFEGVNQTYHKALDTATGYTLEHRNDYYAFVTFVHSLYIIPLILEDQGEWRCVVHDVTGIEYRSRPLDLNVYVRPASNNFYISPNNSYLVVDQTQEFTCLVDGIHPEPNVLWKLNDAEYKGNTTTKQRDDQLWNVRNIIRLKMNTPGVNMLQCVIRTKTGDPWVMNHINVTVQEQAIVLYPQRDQTQTVDVYSTFSLSCSGSGYNPRITWKRNGEKILRNDTRYIIMEECVNPNCDGYIKSKPMDPLLACESKEHYSGLYTCAITLEPPYLSSAVSSDINVTISKTQCKEIKITRTAIISSLSVLSVALIALSIVCLVRRRQQQQKGKALGPADPYTPTYETENWLKLCGQIQSFDKVVFFEYGSKRVFMHDLTDLKQYKECTCDVEIYAIIRISGDRFVVTEPETHTLHLLKLVESEFHNLHTLPMDTDNRRTLICAETCKSFIKCKVSGEDLLHSVSIYRVFVDDDKLKPELLTASPVTLHGEPWRLSLIGTSAVLVIVTLSGKIFRGDLNNYSATPDETLVKHIDGGVRSLYVDEQGNIIMGCRGGKIHMYTHAKQYKMMQVGKPVRGLSVIDGQLIMCCGKDGEQQIIQVFPSKQLYN